jgi:hypothetical protein
MSFTSYGIPERAQVKRRVFVSYHHAGDQWYYDTFSSVFHDGYEVISDCSLDRVRNSNDPNYILRYIRENHITGSSTIIVLCGAETWRRKYVDWEIQAALSQKSALLGIKLPELPVENDGCYKPDRLQDNITSGYAKWVWWENIINSAMTLLEYIEKANSADKRLIVNNRAPMYRNR